MSRRAWVALSLVLDGVMLNGAIVLSFLLRYGGELPRFNFDPYLRMAVWITLIQLLFIYVFGGYEPRRMLDPWNIFASMVQAVTVGLLLVVVLTFVLRSFSFPRLVFVITWFMQVILLTLGRWLQTKYCPPRFEEVPVLVVGTGDTARHLVEELEKNRPFGYRVEGTVTRDPVLKGKEFAGLPVLGGVDEIPRIVAERGIKYVVIATPVRERQLIEDLIKVRRAKIRVDVVPDLYEIMVGRIDEVGIGDVPLVSLVKPPPPGYVSTVKRAVDIFLSLLLLLAFLPLWLLIALAVKLTSRGPVFYKQVRVGKGMREYTMYKFRTMVRGAEEETGPVLSPRRDARVTLLGRFLRRTHLDEIPQLLNILLGHMSFVGPRPERPEFVKRYLRDIVGYEERFAVRPGLTGLAQVSGKYATSPENKLKFDLLYIQNQSIFLDLKIILKTVTAVIAGRGSRS
jgi:exopolysaccharide biosynthesis polyprenyl glycosylphosphotransferase